MEEQKKEENEQANTKVESPAIKAILGRKIGMTQIYRSNGEFIPVTVLEAGPCPVLQVKNQEKDGYTALQLGFGVAKEKNTSKPLKGHFKKSKVSPTQWIREVRIAKIEGFSAGQEIRLNGFAVGDMVDVSGVNKGKGFAGVMKRHRFHGAPHSHGHSEYRRAPGSSGGQQPQSVFKGRRNPGHMGAVWTTVQRLEVVEVKVENNIMLVYGSVPGANGSCVTIKETSRPKINRSSVGKKTKK